jgi:hypothetical protein
MASSSEPTEMSTGEMIFWTTDWPERGEWDSTLREIRALPERTGDA